MPNPFMVREIVESRFKRWMRMALMDGGFYQTWVHFTDKEKATFIEAKKKEIESELDKTISDETYDLINYFDRELS